MPWQEKRAMSLRQEFIALARQEGANVRALCRRYAISPKTAYKWLGRFEEGRLSALQDRSRRPLHHPALSPPSVEQAVVALRQEHPAWGGRKIARCLADQGLACVAPSTVTSILHRHGLIEPAASAQATPWKRFEHALPNSLWQLDFKGRFATLAGPCHALTMLDDHSRFNLALFANARTDTSHVQPLLEQVFRRYGMPVRINADNGPPWGCSSGGDSGLSSLTLWLIQLGVRISHSRPYHPQTNGKLERFHRTLERAGVDLTRINGLAATSVMKLLTEIGPDLSRFASVKHFCSWLGLCPATKISGGKILSSGTKRSANRARQAFKLAAQSLSHSGSALGAFYRRMCSRMDKPRATTAAAHKLARMVYFMLTRGEEFVDKGQQHYEEQQRQRSIAALKRRAADLGFTVAPSAATG